MKATARGLLRIRLWIVGAAVTLATLTLAGAALPVITPTNDGPTLAGALVQSPGIVTGASLPAVPPIGTPNAVSTTALAGFPTDGTSYTILTSGDAQLADDPNDFPNSGPSLGGPNVRGDTDFDVTILKIDLSVPAAANCLSFDFRFLSEEFPEFVNSQYNDAFIAELDTSNWTTAGSNITAPNNFAFDPSNDVISINSSGATSMNLANAAGTTYDGATPLLSASTPITSGAHSLYLSIFDQGDHIYDSAVFLDNLILGTTAPGGCQRGATVLSATKTADSPTTVVGGTNGYTITISNASATAFTITSISDILPAGFSYVANSTTGVTTANPTIAGQTLTWNGPFQIAASGNISLHFNVTVSTTPGDYFNDASAVATGAAVSPTGPTAKITVTQAAAQADLSITKTDSADPVLVGQSLTYTLAVTNAGPAAASGVSLSDTLPAGVTFISATPSQGTCSGTTTITCNLGSLASGVSATVAIVVTPTAAAAPLFNTATVTSTTSDPNQNNNSDTETTIVNAPQADLSITKTDSPDPVTVGQNLTYTLTVANGGPQAATGVSVSDTLPMGVTFVSVTPSQGTCSGTTTITCTLGSLASGASVTVAIVVTPTAAVPLSNTATVTATTPDAIQNNNSDTETTTVNAAPQGADLAITKTDSPDPVRAGGKLIYTIAVRNNGPAAASGVVVVDTLPRGMKLKSVQVSQGTCTGRRTVTCSLGSLASGTNATITIKVKVTSLRQRDDDDDDDDDGGRHARNRLISNTATVSATTNDPNLANNSVTATTAVRRGDHDDDDDRRHKGGREEEDD